MKTVTDTDTHIRPIGFLTRRQLSSALNR